MKLPSGVPPTALGTSTVAQPIGVEYGEDESSGGEVFKYTLPPPVAMSAAVEGTGNKLQTILSYRTSGALRRREGLGIEGAWPSLGNSFWRSGASKTGREEG